MEAEFEAIFGDDSSSESEEEVDADCSDDYNTEILSEDSGEDETEFDQEDVDTKLLIAEAPEVLEHSVPIVKVPGLPLQMRHSGFRICGDNIDKTIRRRHMRSDRGTISLHYFHSFAVQNRVDFSGLSDSQPDNSGIVDMKAMACAIQPTKADDQTLRRNFATFVSRILCKRMKFFKLCFDGLVNRHIEHRYSYEMSQKSLVVSIIIMMVYRLVHSFSQSGVVSTKGPGSTFN